MRVTDSGTLRRLGEEELLSAGMSLSARGRRGSDPVLSDVEWLGLLADALLSPEEGLILRKFEEDMSGCQKYGGFGGSSCRQDLIITVLQTAVVMQCSISGD